MSQTLRKISHIEAYNEIGELVYFEMPAAAIHYGENTVSFNDEERIRNRIEKMASDYCAKADKPDAIVRDEKDLRGKTNYINNIFKKGHWI